MDPLGHYLNEISLSTHPSDHPIVLPPPGEGPQYAGMLRDFNSGLVCLRSYFPLLFLFLGYPKLPYFVVP